MDVFDPAVSSTAAYVIGTAGFILFAATLIGTPRPLPDAYDVRLAWRLALQYFGIGLAIGAACNVIGTILTRRPLGDGSFSNPAFTWWLIACVVVEVAAYGVIWPMGTLTHGRPRRAGWQLGFGLAWGICESCIFLSIFAVSERFIGNEWIAGIVALVGISAFIGIWHDAYWDIRVAPEHNIPVWNPRKVFFCHIPNLCITLPFLAVYRAPTLFMGFQTIALMLSVWFMRFPAPDTPVLGVTERQN